MNCERWQEAISARLDGEESPIDVALVDAHLQGCANCQAFEALGDDTRRRSRMREAEPQPDLSRHVAKLGRIADRARAWRLVRLALALVAVEIIVLAVPDLLGHSNVPHEARHLGAFSVAYAAALLVVVVRPARARAVLPVAIVLGVALLLTAAVDLLNGRVPAIDETLHIPQIISALLLWLLARPAGQRSTRATAAPLAPSLTVVDDRRNVS
ncbi:MAG: zf-HC2 domain-containing protein [Actinomycetota bacterium]